MYEQVCFEVCSTIAMDCITLWKHVLRIYCVMAFANEFICCTELFFVFEIKRDFFTLILRKVTTAANMYKQARLNF